MSELDSFEFDGVTYKVPSSSVERINVIGPWQPRGRMMFGRRKAESAASFVQRIRDSAAAADAAADAAAEVRCNHVCFYMCTNCYRACCMF